MNLTSFLIEYGIRSTSNFQLKEILNDLNINGKVLMRDELCNIKTTKNSNIIMNLQTTMDEGSHWVAIFKSDDLKSDKLKSKGLQYYFDPYGVLPNKEVYNYFGSEGSLEQPLIYNKIQVQQDGTECCGQLSMYFLYQMNRFSTRTEEKAVEIILSMKKELEYLQFLA